MACTDYPLCSRENCGRVACQHDPAEPHPLNDNLTQCEGYLFPPGQTAADFKGGGGSSGGGGASGSW